MVVASLVETARSERLKKRFSIPEENEYQCSSGPLNDFVLLSVLQAMPSQAGLSKRRSRPLKRGYVADLVREGGVSPCCMILGLIYIQRLASNNPSYMATLSPRQLFLIAMVVASKYLNDEGEMEALTNSEWATVGAVPKQNLDILERNFLKAMDWKLYVPLDEFYSFVNSVEGRVALQQAMSRGWLSYTDLAAIWNSSDTYTSMLQYTTKVAFTGATLYLMCVSTLLAAAHTFCSNNAMPTGSSPPFSPTLPSPSTSSSSSSSSTTLPGLPLDQSTSHIWPANSTSVLSHSSNNANGKRDVFKDPRPLLDPVGLPDDPALTRSLLQPDRGQEILFKPFTDATFTRTSANFDLGLKQILCNILRLKCDWKYALEESSQLQGQRLCGGNFQNCQRRTRNNHPVVKYARTPGTSHQHDERGGVSLAYWNTGVSVDGAKVQVPQALELGYSHGGTFHWDPLLNTSSWTGEHKIGTFGLIAQYFVSS